MPESTAKKPKRFLENTQLIRFYLWKYKKPIGIGLLALITVDALDILPPLFFKKAVDITVEKGPTGDLAALALIYFFTSVAQALCRYGWRMYLIRASFFAGLDMRAQFSKHLFGLSMSYFNRTSLGNLMSLATNDVEAVRLAIGSGILVFVDALFFLVTVPIAMCLLSWKLTLLACLPLPLIPILVIKHEKLVNERFHQVQECFGKISSLAQESLSGIRVIKAFARENTQIERMINLGNKYIQLNLKLARIQTGIGPVMDFLMSLGTVILLFWGGHSLIQDSENVLTLGTFVAFQQYIQKMVWPMAALGMSMNYYQRAITSSNRLKDVLSTTTDVPDPESPVIISRHLKKGKVEFNRLSFAFPGSSQPILKGIDLIIEPGERVAIVGAIGAGKSALLSLLPRLYPIQRGMLKVDGVDINDWPIQELRDQVGYVSQDIFLFSETILENVAFGLHNWLEQNSLLPSIEESARLACVHDEILTFRSSYQTRLGERGINLSGGQKQRLTIARAIAKQPSILVLDDALSSVDVQTEEKILQGLRLRKGRNTELIAAHRISTIIDADRIVVLNQGKIVQMGTHSQLVKDRSGEYWKFFEQQQLKEDLENYQHGLEKHF
jgi:ATP-binding cassette, subfamily B, multidrug efflux pump